MKFMAMVKSSESHGPPPQELMDAIAEAGRQGKENGTLYMSSGLAPSAMSARVTLRNGEVSVHDGPFAEAKELVGGFAIFEVDSLEEAKQLAKEFIETHQKLWPGWEGESEIRPMFEA